MPESPDDSDIADTLAGPLIPDAQDQSSAISRPLPFSRRKRLVLPPGSSNIPLSLAVKKIEYYYIRSDPDSAPPLQTHTDEYTPAPHHSLADASPAAHTEVGTVQDHSRAISRSNILDVIFFAEDPSELWPLSYHPVLPRSEDGTELEIIWRSYKDPNKQTCHSFSLFFT